MTQGVPIILLTALGEMSEKVYGMQLGADDYMTKPFDPRELRARVQTHLKRTSSIAEQPLDQSARQSGNSSGCLGTHQNPRTARRNLF